MGKLKVLVVDDESRMRKLVRDYLTKDGYEVLEASDGEEALEQFYDHPDVDLILLDVMMPKRNGFEVLKEIRESSEVPVLMLTAKGSEEDELQGFSLGVDEYITKPFRPKILTARVGAVIRRSHPSEQEQGTMEVGGIMIDSHAHSVTVDGTQVILSVKEFDLLVFLVENRGIALSREQILNAVWNFDYFGDARTIDTHIKKLRSKLGSKGDYIKTIWGLGYKFDMDS